MSSAATSRRSSIATSSRTASRRSSPPVPASCARRRVHPRRALEDALRVPLRQRERRRDGRTDPQGLGARRSRRRRERPHLRHRRVGVALAPGAPRCRRRRRQAGGRARSGDDGTRRGGRAGEAPRADDRGARAPAPRHARRDGGARHRGAGVHDGVRGSRRRPPRRSRATWAASVFDAGRGLQFGSSRPSRTRRSCAGVSCGSGSTLSRVAGHRSDLDHGTVFKDVVFRCRAEVGPAAHGPRGAYADAQRSSRATRRASHEASRHRTLRRSSPRTLRRQCLISRPERSRAPGGWRRRRPIWPACRARPARTGRDALERPAAGYGNSISQRAACHTTARRVRRRALWKVGTRTAERRLTPRSRRRSPVRGARRRRGSACAPTCSSAAWSRRPRRAHGL